MSSFEGFEQRKRDHIKYALDSRTQSLDKTDLDKIRLTHVALPEIDFRDVSLNTKLLGHDFLSPHFVSSMTAGHENSASINLNLAEAASANGWLMAVGSQRRELTDISAGDEWRKIKEKFPSLKLLSNIGILEVIRNQPDKILELTGHLEAIGIFVHLNPLQEVFQNISSGEVQLNFSGSLKAIENLVKKSSVPVLVKEVGFGINRDLTRKLFDIGVKIVDVSGRGGTHWGHIEALRQDESSQAQKMSPAFFGWGQSSVECLLQLQDQNLFSQIWASGGIRSGVDSAKCLALGARAVGIAQPLMKAALQSSADVSALMKQFDMELKISMFCVGIKKCEDFLHKKVWYGPGI